jgi:pilus assembly protein CpaF
VIEPDKFLIRDASGKAGINVQGILVAAYGPLKKGDEINIGGCLLRVLRNGFLEAQNNHQVKPDRVRAQHAKKRVIRDAQPVREVTDIKAGRHSDDSVTTQLRKELQQKVMMDLDLYKRSIIDSFDTEKLKEEAINSARKVVEQGRIDIPGHIDREQLLREAVAEAIGLGPLETNLEDESISEIMVNGPDKIFIERRGRVEKSATRFTSVESLMSIIERIVTPLGRRIDEGSPMVDARLPDGSRVNAIIPPLSLVGPVLTIRKFSKQRFSFDRLVELDSLSAGMADFLKLCVKHHKSIVVSGGTGSGKTTFLNALSEHIPDSERIVTIEDAAELQLHQDHVVSLESRPANVEGKGQVAIRDLVRNALRMRPDRIVIGECRGGEALDMLQAMNTGHEGSLTTAHANTPRDLLSRLEVMVLMAGMDMPVRVIREQIASAVDIVVQQTRMRDGRRRVTSIVEIDGMEGEVILMQKLFEFRQTGVGPNGEIDGEYRGMGDVPSFYDELEASGYSLDRSIFGMAKGYDDDLEEGWGS